MTPFEKAVIEQLARIGDALTILSAAVVMDDPAPEDAGCEHDWVDLGDERECRKPNCKAREKT